MRGFQIKGAVLAAAGFAAITTMASAAGFGDEHGATTSQTTTSTTKNGDTTTTTTTTHSETTSHGFGFGFGPFDNNKRGFSYESLGGSWHIGEEHGDKTCELTLESQKFISNYGARTGIGCPEGLFGVSSWVLAGDEIRLMSPGGSVLAKLHPAGYGRWNGSTTAGLAVFMTRQ
ncbi:MAG: AprI/Inh family metalloprotease inhibitor [Rhizomicrobium sp.]|jgi:hypothetical protein